MASPAAGWPDARHFVGNRDGGGAVGKRWAARGEPRHPVGKAVEAGKGE